MKTTHWFVVLLLCTSYSLKAIEARMDEKQRQFFREYCTECHDEKKQKGQVRLDNIPLELNSVELAERWQKILNQLNSGEMPPDDSRQPEKRAKTEFLDALSNTLVAARKTLSDQHGKITMRRLNQREYKNTIRDLMGVEVDVRDLPKDGGSGTFDTVGSSLFMSSDQFEQYLVLGRKAAEEAFARRGAETAPVFKKHVEVEDSANPQIAKFATMYQSDYDRWKAWAATEGTQSPKDFKFADKGAAEFAKVQYERHWPYFDLYQKLPLVNSGAYLTIYDGTTHVEIDVPQKQVPGDYILRVRAGAVPETPQERHFVELGFRGERKGEFDILGTYEITGSTTQPEVLEIPLKLNLNDRRRFAIREKQPQDPHAVFFIWDDARRKNGTGPTPCIWVDWLEVEGPICKKNEGAQPVKDQSDIIFKNTNGAPEAEHAKAILERFALRALRDQKPEVALIERLIALFTERRTNGESFEDALKEPISVILASPAFLYLTEPSTETVRRKLSQREFATRLAYFLWSAPPDETLLDLARRGELSKPEEVAKQVDRLIADPRSAAFVDGFVHQWLGMDRLDFFQFDWKSHLNFDESTKTSARREVFQTFAYLLRNGESLSRLLKSDFVVINGLLGNYYGLEGVSGDAFRRVALPADSPRGGLLGMAAVLAMGSNGKDSSPVERGAWVLRKLMHDPPPPAPANVPQLSRLEGKLLTTRERLQAHQEQPQCASCHRKIDPIGFGLENFDAVGLWRAEDGYEAKGAPRKTWKIEAGGAFHKGPAFQSYFELRDLIAAKPESFAQGFTEALIEYALGHPCGFSDDALVTKILRESRQREFNIPAFVHTLVASQEFQSK
jgi:hypothetical protein